MSPTVSVLMPVYNAERYLAEAMESILGQTFRDFEFVIVDDGSTDNSSAILARYAAQDSRLRVHHQPNSGICVTLNKALNLAVGEFIARMDADDVALPGRFEAQVAYLRQHPECIGIGCRVLLIDPEGAPLCPFEVHLTHEAIDEAHLHNIGGAAITHPTLMARREAMMTVGGYRPEFVHAQDVDLFLRLAEVGRLANLPEILLHYRRHIGAVGYAHRDRQTEALGRAIRDARQRRGLNDPEALVPSSAEPAIHGKLDDAAVFSTTIAHRTWAWWALNAGNIATARKHAMATLYLEPLAVESWRVLYCALRGR